VKRSYLLFILIVFSTITPVITTSSAVKLDEKPLKSIILLIGDGMGIEHIKFGELVEYGLINSSSIFNFPYSTQISTTNIYGGTTDSAASATAIGTGVMTENGRIATNWNATIDLTTILEIAQMNGYATGLVASCHLTHATPAAFAAHEAKRSSYQKIAKDFLQSNVDVFFGGGSDNDYIGNYISNFTDLGYTYITEESELNSQSTTPVLGLFSGSSLPRVTNMEEDSTIPSLSEMTSKAINLLNETAKPFFLMIEGSQIDWAGHDNDPIYLIHEMIEFEKTVRIVRNLALQIPDLQVLVTSDHETGGLSVEEYSFQTPTPEETDSFELKKEKRTNRSQEITLDWGTGGHTKTKVILTGMGPYTENIPDAEHHIDTFSIMREAIDGLTGSYEEGCCKGAHRVPYYAWGIIGVTVITIPVTVLLIKRRAK
jgi:alkaline phosphatase